VRRARSFQIWRCPCRRRPTEAAPTPSSCGGGYTGIRGAARCAGRKAACDLSTGIQVDDATGTITFRLTRPDPNFLYKLALPNAVAVPASVGTVAREPVPATGPYKIAPISAHAPLRLERNRRFRPVEGRPAGYPDAITIDCCAAQQPALRAVEQGRADLTGGGFGPEQLGQIDAIATRYAGQLHAKPLAGTNFIFMNMHTPPFDNVDVRRALNYAVDRNAFVALVGGERFAETTCQFLPANFPGYRAYCPYTADAGAGRPWSAPDLAHAQRLIARSHTRGMRVKVIGGPRVMNLQGRLIVALLRRLGYRATLRVLPTNVDYFDYVGDSRNRAQIGPVGWVPDYPAASSMLNLLRCSTPAERGNYSQFCDRRTDELIRRAERLPADDAAADALWAAVDRRVTDQAAVIPLISPKSMTFVSRRVGNFQDSQQWDVLYEQLWVR
jgi:peptide/nickel transport system substrate-binding protein